MDDKNPGVQFFDKLNAEHEAFINDLRGKPSDEIINASYKKVVFDEIVAAFENGDYTERDYAAFNKQDGLIDAIYYEWLDSDTADFEELRTVIDSYFERFEGYKVEHYLDEVGGDTLETADIDESAETDYPVGISTEAINGSITCFDVVISVDADYPYLVGEINAVEKLGSEDHDSGNLTDDVFVDFRSEDYSEQRKGEIEAHFSKLYGEPKRFDELPLDNVIMAPDMLVVVPENDIPRLLNSLDEAKAYCDAILNPAQEKPAPDKPPLNPEKPKSAFELGIERGKAKVAEYKAQKAQDPNKINKHKEDNQL